MQQEQELPDAPYDEEFERGLETILKPMRESGASQEELDLITARARQFYASRQPSNNTTSSQQTQPQTADNQVDISTQEVNSVVSQASQASTNPFDTSMPTSLASDNAPYPVTLEQIAEMIANGTLIPGIREIPKKINEEQPTEAKVAKMQGAGKKPWEK